MMPHHSLTRPESKNGFALVISLSLMAFVLLLVLSITTLVQVESQSSNIQKQQTAAQQQALLGLQLALGELQRTAGPDQRVTATADILTNSNASKRNTVGVWSSEDLNNDGTPDGTLLRWLSSDAVDTNGLPDNSYNEDAAAGIILVGAGSLPDTNNDGIPDDTNDAIVIDVSNTTVTKNNATVGRYGWWIGDEGVKGRINLTRPDATGQIATKQRGVLETGGSSTNSPSALIGLTGIDFENDAGLLQQLNDLELIPGGITDAGKHYFHDLTTVSAGVLADAKNGGLKKDLSLAFEMSDDDFDNSALASNGPSAINAPGYTRGQVQPVFTLSPSDASTTYGPVWNLLRQYYRLYQQVENPMTNPTLDAQIVGPSLAHSNPDFNRGAETNYWWQQTAIEWGGGPAVQSFGYGEIMGPNWQGVAGGNDVPNPTDALGKLTARSTFAMTLGQDGDPLRSNSNMPVMVQSSYTPYLVRALATTGIFFREKDNNPNQVEYRLASKEVYMVHNPYNVALNHRDISFDWLTSRISMTSSATGGAYLQGGSGAVERRAFIENTQNSESGPLEPGEMRQYEGKSRMQREFAEELDGSIPPLWHGIKQNNNFLRIRNNVTKPASGSISITTYPGLRSGLVNNNSTHYTSSAFTVIQSMRPNDDTSLEFQSSNRPLGGRWPITSAISSYFIGPGINYDGAPSLSASDYRFNDPNNNDWATTVNLDVATYLSTENKPPQSAVAPLITYDLQLRPAEFETLAGGNTVARYPTYALSNPMAPVKDSKNLFPVDDEEGASTGFPKFSPDWELTISTDPYSLDSDYRIWGPTDGSTSPSGGVERPVQLEIPTTPLQSLGQLQHANITIHGHMPALAVSNSLASPYIPKDETYELFQNRYGNERIFYDISYLMNEALWDEYFFSSYSTVYDAGNDRYGNAPSADFNSEAQAVGETFDNAFLNATSTLPNSRMYLMPHEAEDATEVKAKLFEQNNAPLPEGYLRSAENLMVSGAFNINSTSVEAWRSVLSGARNQSIYRYKQEDAETVVNATAFSRLSQPVLGQSDNDSASDESWSGFRALTDDQIEQLAQAIVDEIKERSGQNGRPYLSLSEFVNRELQNDDHGLCGVLQAAIDQSLINDSLVSFNEVSADNLGNTVTGAFPQPNNIETANGTARTGGMAAPAHVMQADILQAIGSYIAPRSDTFRIRSYGDSRSPATGDIQSRAWCEAVVQRIPTPAAPRAGTTPDDAEYWEATDINDDPLPQGRKFQIISFRWLSEDEV